MTGSTQRSVALLPVAWGVLLLLAAHHVYGSAPHGHVVFGSDDLRLRAVESDSGLAAWSYTAPLPIKTSPAKWDDDVADHDRVVFGTGLAGGGDGHVVMVDAKADGALMWNHSLGAPVLASPAVEGDTVFAGSDGGDFVALSAFTGDLLWSVSVDAKIRSDPQVFGPVEDAASRPRYVVVFASEVGGVHAYYVDTTVVGSTAGESAWAAPGNVGGDTECDLLYDANTTSLYIGTEGGALVAIDALTGETRFTANTGNRIRSRPAIADVFNHTVRTNCSDPCPPRFFGRYVVAVNFNGNSNGQIFAYDANTAEQKWTQQFPGITHGPLAIQERESDSPLVYVASGNAPNGAAGTVRAYDMLLGTEVWAVELQSTTVAAGVSLAHTTLFVPGEAGVTALDALDGRQLWRFEMETPREIRSTPLYLPSPFGPAGPPPDALTLPDDLLDFEDGLSAAATVGWVVLFVVMLPLFCPVFVAAQRAHPAPLVRPALLKSGASVHESRVYSLAVLQFVLAVFLVYQMWWVGLLASLIAGMGVYASVWRDTKVMLLYLVGNCVWAVLLVDDFVILASVVGQCNADTYTCKLACAACGFARFLIFVSVVHLAHMVAALAASFLAWRSYSADAANASNNVGWAALPKMVVLNIVSAARGHGVKAGKRDMAGHVNVENPVAAAPTGRSAPPPPPSRSAPPPPPSRV